MKESRRGCSNSGTGVSPVSCGWKNPLHGWKHTGETPVSLRCKKLRCAHDEVALNIGADEKLVGIEILDAKEVLAAGKMPNLSVENLPLVAA